MSMLTIAFPAEAAISAVQAVGAPVAVIARAALSVGLLGILATALMIFKPLLKGILHAALLVLRPARLDLAKWRAEGAHLLEKTAKEFDRCEPGQAEELRRLASRS